MSPSEKGAFCGKCQIDVVDFSGKSPEDVKLILQENVGKHLCGRFKKTQLEDLNYSYAEWDDQSPRVFQSKFLYACMIVFGMTLFSCNTPEDYIMGDISMEHYQPDTTQSETENIDTTNRDNTLNTTVETTETPNQQEDVKHIKGKVDYNYNENDYIKGDVAYVPDPVNPIDTVVTTTCSTEDTTTSNMEENNEPEITISENTSGVIIENETTTSLFSAKIYPNPTGTITTLEIAIKESGYFLIDLVSMSGERIQIIYSGELTEGISNHRIDLSVYSTGTYLVKVSSGSQTEICKIIKVE